MNTQHTPGPWRVGSPPPNGEQTIGTKNGLMVAVATTGQGVSSEANARLIAAAPDLLAACIEALSLFDNHPECYEAIGTFQVLNSAIAKAKGQS